MITIGQPYIVEDSDRAYLKAKIEISKDTAQKYIALEPEFPKTHWRLYENYPPVEWHTEDSGLYFAVPKEYKEYLCADRADAFLVAMFWYAMVTKSDITLKAPVSEQIAFKIRNYLIPALCGNAEKYRRIELYCETVKELYPSENKVGTGMSCGVDSLYSLLKYTQEDIPEQYKLTHLTYFNMGAIFHPNTRTNEKYTIKEFYEITDKMSEEKCENAKLVADRKGMPLVYVASNLDEDYYRGAYGYTGVYRNCACALALQGLFGVYYCSSAGWPDFFDLSLSEGSEHYETLLAHVFSNGNLQFIVSDYVTRFEKTQALSTDEIAKEFLDVCFNFDNCGVCSKCYRTLLTLDLLGEVDSFSNVFDVEQYKRNRMDAYVWLLHTKNGGVLDDNAVFARDIYKVALKNNVIPKAAYYKFYKEKYGKKIKTPIISIVNKIKNIVRRIVRKTLRVMKIKK